MHPTKYLLLCKYGTRCMCCGEEKPLKELQWHHIKPKYDFLKHNEPIDNSEENGALLCRECHVNLHKYWYGTAEYMTFTQEIIRNKEHS